MENIQAKWDILEKAKEIFLKELKIDKNVFIIFEFPKQSFTFACIWFENGWIFLFFLGKVMAFFKSENFFEAKI